MVDCIKDCQRPVEQLCLILCKIAYLHVMAYLEVAGKGDFAHDALHKR